MLDPAAWSQFLDKNGVALFILVGIGVASGYWFFKEGWPNIKANQQADRAERAGRTAALESMISNDRQAAAADRTQMVGLLQEQVRTTQKVGEAMEALTNEIRGMRQAEIDNTTKILEALSNLVQARRPTRRKS